VLKHAPSALWIGAGAILMGASAFALLLERHLPEHALRTPHRVRAAEQLAAADPVG
jgi:hypothetical protein